MRSGKATFLKYDDFNKKLPLLTERIKVKMLEQDIDYFYYGDIYPYQPFYNKIDYLLKAVMNIKTNNDLIKSLLICLKVYPKQNGPTGQYYKRCLNIGL
ncbi:hypothetical protein P4S63_19255 [Pseudoalteromonas sp. B193]